MAKRRILQVCTATARDGRRCGRYCAPGEVLCSKHNPNAKPVGVIAAQDSDDLGVLLQRLTKDRDPSIRLRAIEARLKWEERRSSKCPVCETRAADDALRARFLAALTDEERERATTILGALRGFRESVYERRPDLRPESDPVHLAPKPISPTIAPASAPDLETPDAPCADPEPVREPKPQELPPECYAAAGLIVLDGGLVTHSLGDDHARRILAGEISFEDARAATDAAKRQNQQITHSLLEHRHA